MKIRTVALISLLAVIFASSMSGGLDQSEVEKKQKAAKQFWVEIRNEAYDAYKKANKKDLEKILVKVNAKIPMIVAGGGAAGELRAYVLYLLASLNFDEHGYAACGKLCEEALYYNPGEKEYIMLRHWALYHPHQFGQNHTDDECPDAKIKSKALEEREKWKTAFAGNFQCAKKLYDETVQSPAEKKMAALKKALQPLTELCSQYKYFWACEMTEKDKSSLENDPRYLLARIYAEMAFISSEKDAVNYAKKSLEAWPNAGKFLMSEDWIVKVLVVLGEYKTADSK